MVRSKIRCLFMIDVLWGFAGTEKHLLQIIRGLNREEFECMVVAFRASDPMIGKYESEGVRLVNLNLERIYGFRALMKLVVLVWIIRSFRPDIVQTFHFMADTYGVFASRIAGVRAVVSSRRDMGDRKRKRQLALNRVMNLLTTRFIAVCKRVGQELAEVEKVPRSRIFPILNGVELDLYEAGDEAKTKARKSADIPMDAFVVGNVSILRPEKDLHLFLEAAFGLRGAIPNLVVLVVGDGPMKEELVEYVRARKLEDVVTFTGYLDDVRDHVQCMDVVCMTPKDNEGLSNAILEEMAMGKAVIATDVGGNAELIVDGETGFIIEPGDAGALSDRILRLYKDPARREEMGREARKRVEKFFTLEHMIENLESFYRDLRNKRA